MPGTASTSSSGYRPSAASEAAKAAADSLGVLAEYRIKGVRASDDVVRRGEAVLQRKGALKAMGDDVWPFLEQLGFAALDTGKTGLASICIERLHDKFPGSPRVSALQGLLLELTSLEKAKEFYEKELSEDENNVLVRKRLIALHLNCGSVDDSTAALSVHKGIELLVDHLDTVYNDPEGWSQLVDVYERLGMLQQALSCLSDLILLQPTNTFHVLRSAETQYTLGDYSAAYRTFCRALEMAGPMHEGGLGRRAGLGIKMSLRKLDNRASPSASKDREVRRRDAEAGDAKPKKANDIDALVTSELLNAYTKSWVDPGDRVAGHDESKLMTAWLASTGKDSAVTR